MSLDFRSQRRLIRDKAIRRRAEIWEEDLDDFALFLYVVPRLGIITVDLAFSARKARFFLYISDAFVSTILSPVNAIMAYLSKSSN